MYRDVAQWQHVRRRILMDGTPKKQVVCDTGISRRTINKMLKHQYPTGYGPRLPRYPKLGPYIPALDRLLQAASTLPSGARLSVRCIVKRLRNEEGFDGSYDSVRNYMRHRAQTGEMTWERIHGLIIELPKGRALEVIRLLSRDDPSVLMSARLQSFVHQARYPPKRSIRSDRDRRRLTDIEWRRRVLQEEISDVALHQEFGKMPKLDGLLKQLRRGRLLSRNRAMAVLASYRRIPTPTICAFLGVGKRFVRTCRSKFDEGGIDTLFAPQTKSNRKIDNPKVRTAVFSLLHEPPANHGINRTSWTIPLLSHVLKRNGTLVGTAVISKMIKEAGYRWRKAKVVLTSNDPAYLRRLNHIRSILSNLQPDEAFFSIDEYGPFAIKSKPGRTLAPPGIQPTVPQFQKSRGCVIMTAALELAENQVTHFYSAKKNTTEMIRMMELLIERYAGLRKLYLSWDAASWHISKELFARIEEHNAAARRSGGPRVETAPLPAGAQFLNVIESVFSGMARAIIHNSDYASLDEAKAAIDRYFAERNAHFRQHPRRAGKKTMGKRA